MNTESYRGRINISKQRKKKLLNLEHLDFKYKVMDSTKLCKKFLWKINKALSPTDFYPVSQPVVMQKPKKSF